MCMFEYNNLYAVHELYEMHLVETVQQAIQIHMYIYTYLQTQMYMYIHIHMHAVAQSWSKTAGNAQRRHHSKRSQKAETLSLRYCYGGKGAQIMGTRHVGVVARQVSWYIARTTFVVSHRKLLRDFSRCVSPTHFFASDETCLNTTFSWMIYMITPWHAYSCTTSYWLIHRDESCDTRRKTRPSCVTWLILTYFSVTH